MQKKLIIFLIALAIIAIVIASIIKFSSPNVISESSGKRIKVGYIIYVNNSVYESSELSFEDSFSKQLGLVGNKADSYFDNVKVSDEFNISLKAEEAYGNYNESLRKIVNRTMSDKRIIELNLGGEITQDQFYQVFNQLPIVNQTYSSTLLPFKIKVTRVDNNNVNFVFDVKINDQTAKDQNGFWLKVVKVDEKNNLMQLKLEGEPKKIATEKGLIDIWFDEENIYYKLTPKIGDSIEWHNEYGKVASYNETHIIFDNNHPLAGKDIVITIRVLDVSSEIIKASCKANSGPTFDVFIMSYCPFGIQFVKGLLPVWKALENDANINVRFVSYTMHGQKEANENARMVCIREEQCESYRAYLECFVQSGDSESCINKLNIDKTKLDECMAKKAQSYLEYDAQLNEKYGVKGSPTVVLNGKQIEVWPRSPANIARILCESFTSEPSACSQRFSDENPGPGFGTSSTSSNLGSCGAA
ncbi:MAG: hypothetical protein QW244_01620 [Candidatus Pacearchaeota archaeon]